MAISAFNGACPAARYLWRMVQYSINQEYPIVDRDFFFKYVPSISSDQFIENRYACAYVLDLYLTLAISGNELDKVDAVVGAVLSRKDWSNFEGARIYLYLHAADAYINNKQYARVVALTELMSRIAASGTAQADVYKLYLMSLIWNQMTPQSQREVRPEIDRELGRVRSYMIMSPFSVTEDQTREFGTLNSNIVATYIKKTEENFQKLFLNK
jgi:hypothetical protein